MSTYEPSPLEICLTLVLGTLAGAFYRRYVERLPLRGSERVIDFGAGSGVCSRFLAARLERGGGRLTCVDVSQNWNRVIRRTLKSYRCVDFLTGPVAGLPLPEGCFDAVFIHFVLHDIPAAERPAALRCLASKLAPGGQVFIREPFEGGRLPAAEVRRLMEQAGLAEVSAREETHWYTGPLFEAIFRKQPGK